MPVIRYRWAPIFRRQAFIFPLISVEFMLSIHILFSCLGICYLYSFSPHFIWTENMPISALINKHKIRPAWGPDTIHDFHPVFPASVAHYHAWKFQVGQISDSASILAQMWWILACLQQWCVTLGIWRVVCVWWPCATHCQPSGLGQFL